MEASEQVRAPPATVPGDEVANLKKLVTELRCHVAFLKENKPDNWQGLEELWKLRCEVEDLRFLRVTQALQAASLGGSLPSVRKMRWRLSQDPFGFGFQTRHTVGFSFSSPEHGCSRPV